MQEQSLSLKIGDIDPNGYKVVKIYAKSPEKKYAIWEIEQGVVCDTDDEGLAKYPQIINLTLKIAGLSSAHLDIGKNYRSQTAYAYKVCFDGNPDGCATALSEIHGQLVKALQRRSKNAFLTGALIVIALVFVVWLALHSLHSITEKVLLLNDVLFSGALGGLLSVATDKQKTRVELEDSWRTNMLYGGLRVLVGGIAGFVASLMIHAGFILTILLQKDIQSGVLLACVLSGFSERFVYRALRSLEGEEIKTASPEKNVTATEQNV